MSDLDELDLLMDELSQKKHISVSQIGQVKRCPRQWVYRYIEGKKVAPGIALITGSSFDEAMNMNYGQKIETKTDLPVEQMVDKFSDELDRRAEELENPEDKKEKDGIKDVFTAGIPLFCNQIVSKVQPVAIQTKVLIPLDDQFDFLGFLDLETETKIIDNKTASRYTDDFVKKYMTQLKAYVWAIYETTGQVKATELNTLVKTKKPSCKVDIVDNIKPTDFLQEETRTINFIKKLHADPDMAFKNTDGWHCSQKWCGYYNECQGK
jgi:hypothetical protein